MAGVSFDDLIPAEKPAAKRKIDGVPGFDDLIPPPKSPAEPDKDANQGTAAARGLVEGVPIVGPYALDLLERVGAGAESLLSGKSMDDELKRIRERGAASDKAYPGTKTGFEITGGVLGSAPLVMAAPAAFGAGSAGLAARTAASGASGMVLGAADQAARTGGDLQATGMGAAIGGGAGLAGPAVVAGAGRALAPVAGVVAPKIAAADRVVRALLNSGHSPEEIAEGMARARSLGKGDVYTLADELGPQGGKALGTAARGPGTAHDRIVEALNARQAAQPERILGDLDDAFATGGTAKAESARLLQEARDASRAKFAEARALEVPADPRIDQLVKHPAVADGVARGAEIESLERLARGEVDEAALFQPSMRAVEKPASSPAPAASEARQGAKNEALNAEALVDHTAQVRRELIDLGIPERGMDKAALEEAARASMQGQDGIVAYERAIERAGRDAPAVAPGTPAVPFDAADAAAPVTMRQLQQAKIGLDAAVEAERDAIKGLSPRGRALDDVRRSLVKELERINPAYAEANALYRGPMEVRDAVEIGLKAGRGGRIDDNLAEFRKLTVPSEQQGFRQGYVEPYAARLEKRTGEGVDHSRMFTSPKARAEFEEFAFPGRAEEWRGRLGLESTMSDTRRRALGNSATAERLADDTAFSAPGLVSALMSGDVLGAVKSGGRGAINAASGNLPKVRERVAEILLRTAADRGEGALEEITREALRRREIANLIAQGAIGGGRAYTGQANR